MMAHSSKVTLPTTLLECPVCHGLKSTPKCFPCGHTVCEICINSLVLTQEMNAHSEGTKWENKINCPLCRRETVVHEGQAKNLPTNYSMKQLQMAALGMAGTRKVHNRKGWLSYVYQQINSLLPGLKLE